MKKNNPCSVGRLLMVGVEGLSLTEQEKDFLRDVQPQGVIYFRRNIESPNQVIDLTREIQACIKHPVMIGIDQEGGNVARLSSPWTVFPGNEELIRNQDAKTCEKRVVEKATMMARELKAVGIHLNFTPVADLLTNPSNPIMKHRTFGSDPEGVAKMVVKTIKAYQKQGVLCCAKHFPGHGDTTVDSHLALAEVDIDQKTLLSRELVPFQKAIQAKVPLIMTAHILFPQIDADHPATLSKKILQTILVQKLKFSGLIVSDDMEMKAIAHHYDIDQAVVSAVQAGCHLVLICKDQDWAYQSHVQLQKQAKNPLIQKRLSEALGCYQKWQKTYLASRVLRKKPIWGWKRHQEKVDKWSTKEGIKN